jgi:hypothetical protein
LAVAIVGFTRNNLARRAKPGFLAAAFHFTHPDSADEHREVTLG